MMGRESHTPTDELVHYELDGAVATITLDSPQNRNALSTRLVEGLLAQLGRADQDPAVRVVVLTHTGSTFCAGADLSEAPSGDGDPVRARGDQLAEVLRTIITLGTPVIGRIDGNVRAGGMGLVGACDVVVAGPRATFALTESRLGVAAAVISPVVLPRLTARDASRYFLTGDTFDAETAARIGFVTEAAEDTAGAAATLCASFLAASPQGLRESKRLVNHGLVERFDAERERLITQSARLFASEDAAEGMLAFLQKRPPSWVRSATAKTELQ
jgi:enoyl-CoA hydratase